MVEIGFEGVEGDRDRRIAGVAPEFEGVEAHAIAPLRLLALRMGVGVGIDETAAHDLDRADVIAGVARQTRMAGRMQVLHAHSVANGEQRLRRRRPRGRPAPAQRAVHDIGGEDAVRPRRVAKGPPGHDLLLRHETFRAENFLEGGEPDFVIAARQVARRRQGFARKAAGVAAPLAEGLRGDDIGEHAAFPRTVKRRLVRLRQDGTKAHRATKILSAVHRRAAEKSS